MAISLVGVTNAPGATAAVTTFATNVPAGVANGDLLLWTLVTNSINPATAQAGWSTWSTGTTTGLSQTTFWRYASSEPASYTATGLGSGRWGGAMVAYRGVDQTTPQDISFPASNQGTTATTYPQVSPITSGAWIVPIGSIVGPSAVVDVTWVAGNVDVLDTDAGSNTGSTNEFVCHGHELWTSGSFTPTGPTTGTTSTRTLGTTTVIRPSVGASNAVDHPTSATFGGPAEVVLIETIDIVTTAGATVSVGNPSREIVQVVSAGDTVVIDRPTAFTVGEGATETVSAPVIPTVSVIDTPNGVLIGGRSSGEAVDQGVTITPAPGTGTGLNVEVRRYLDDTNWVLIESSTTERKGYISVEASLLYDEPGFMNLVVDSQCAAEQGLADQVVIGIGLIYPQSASQEFARYTIESSQKEVLFDGRVAWTFSGRSFFARLEDAKVYPSAWPSPIPAGHGFVNATAGTQMRTLGARAQERGTIIDLDFETFTGVKTSDNQAWDKITSVEFGSGQSYLEALQDMITKGLCEAEMVGKSLRLYNADSTLSVHHSDIFFQSGDNLAQMDRETDSRDLGNVILIEGDQGAAQEYVDTGAVNNLGRRRERYVSHGGITDTGTLRVLAQAEADQYKQVLEEVNIEIAEFADYPQPFKDYKPGHWVWLQRDTGYQEVRVRQLSVSASGDKVSAAVTLNDKIAEQLLVLQRKIDAITGETQYGAISNPDKADTSTPSPPLGVTLTSSAYTLPSGTTNAQITVQWLAPVTNIDTTTLDDLGGFDIQYKLGTEAWTPMGEVDSATLSAYASGLPTGKQVQARVRAKDTSIHVSDWTFSNTTTTAGDGDPPDQPSTPVVSSAPLALRVDWDGLSATGGSMPNDVYQVWVCASKTSGFIPSAANRQQIMGKGQQTVYLIDLEYGATYYVRLVAIDFMGNTSPPSNEGSAVMPQIHTEDVADGLITELKLAQNAVTTDKIFPEAVTTEKLVVGAFAPTAIPNAGFEDAKSGNPTEPAAWFRNGQVGAGVPMVRDTSSPISGGASVRLDPTPTDGQTIVSSPIDVTPDTAYQVSVRLKSSNDPPTTTPPSPQTVGTVASGTAGVTPGLPSGTSTNDILLLYTQCAGGETVATPSGYTLEASSSVGSGATGTKAQLFWKRAGGSETAPTIADPGDHVIAIMQRVSGCVTTGSPFSGTSVASNEGSADTSGTVTGMTTLHNNTLVMSFTTGQRTVAADGTTEYSAYANSDLASITEYIDQVRNIGIDGSIGVAGGVVSAAGMVGDTTYTQAGAALKASIMFALQPVPIIGSVNVKVEVQTAPNETGLDTAPTVQTIYASGAGTTPITAEIDGGVSIPSTHKFARIALTGNPLASPYSVWFDDVVLAKIVGTAQIANLAVIDAKIQNMSASKITVGTLLADITLSARIKTADVGQRFEANTTGAQVYRSDGTKAAELSPSQLATFAMDGTTALFQALSSTGAIILRSGTSGPRIEINSTVDAASFRLYTGSADQTATPAKITTDFNDAASPREAELDIIGPNIGQDIPPKIVLLGKKELVGGNPNNNTVQVTGVRSFKVTTANHATDAILVNEQTERVNVEPPWVLHTRDIASDSYIGMSGDSWNMRARNPPSAPGAWGQWWGTNGNVAMTLGGDDSVRSTNAAGGTFKPMQASAYQTPSDINIKRKVKDLPAGQLEKLKNLRTISFEYKNDPEQGTKRGVVAQEIAEHIPEAHYVNDEGAQMVDMMGLTTTILEAIKELAVRIEVLEENNGA